MKRILTQLIILLSIFYIHSTTLYSKSSRTDIKGVITEKINKAPLPYATITVVDAEDRVLFGTISGDNGEFTLNALNKDACKIKVSFIGFKDLVLDFTASDTTLDLGTLELEADNESLAASIVTAKIPFVEHKLDKVIVNISESVIAKTSNGYEILRKSPGVTIDKDGNILLNGQGVEIWIDGRPSRMSGTQLETMLSALDGSSLDKIEIMQHPSAKFDASGSGGIINIKTKKNFIKGLYGNVSATYIMRPDANMYNGARGSVNLNYRSKKANTYIAYSSKYTPSKNGFENINRYGVNYEMSQYSNSELESTSKSNMVRGGSDLYIDKKNTIGFLASILSSSWGYDSKDIVTNTYDKTEHIAQTQSKIKQQENSINFDANLYYTYAFSDASDITFNFDYSYFDSPSNMYQSNYFFNPQTLTGSQAFKTEQKQYINIASAKIDYKTPFLKKGMFEAGVKWSQTFTDNNMKQLDSVNTKYIENTAQSNLFDYNEGIGAAYISISYQISKKWSVMGGLRTECTKAKGEWISSDTTTKDNYINLFPTLTIGYLPSDNWRVYLSYAYRVKRPNFNDLNPFAKYIDANTILTGNPKLKPEYTHKFSILIGYKSYINMGTFYQRTDKLIMQDPMFDPSTGRKKIIYTNFGSYSLIGGVVSVTELPLAKDKLFLNANGIFSKSKNKSDSDDLSQNGTYISISGGLTAVLPWNIKIESTMNYQGKMQVGYMALEPMWILYAGVKKSFLNDKASFSISMDDILNQCGPNVKMSKDNTEFAINQHQYVRSIRFGLIYKFGTAQAKRRTNQRDDTSSRVK